MDTGLQGRVAELAGQLEREGYVELPLVAWKVVGQALVPLVMSALGVFLTMEGHVVVGPLILVLVPVPLLVRLAETCFGAGPPLRLDREGLQLRRFREPWGIAWHDLVGVDGFQTSERLGPAVRVWFPGELWTEHLATRGPLPRLVDRLTHLPFGTDRWAHIPRVLPVSSRDLLAWLQHECEHRFRLPAQPHLLLVPGPDTPSPLWLARTGRIVLLDDLGLSQPMLDALADWTRRLDAAHPDNPTAEEQRAFAQLWNEGQSLAVQLQVELGPGARVDHEPAPVTTPGRQV